MAVLLDPKDKGISRVEVNGKAAGYIENGSPEQLSGRLWSATENAWYYNYTIRVVFIKVYDEAVLNIAVTYLN